MQRAFAFTGGPNARHFDFVGHKAGVAPGGGGSVLNTSIAAPTLTLGVPANTYPPEVDAGLAADVIAGSYSLRLQADDDYLFGSPFLDKAYAISDSEANAHIKVLGADLSSIVSPAVTFFRARTEWAVAGVTQYTNWSNTQGHGDATAPTITSSTTQTSAELAPVLQTITFSETSYVALGGVDAARIELVGPQPATSIQYRIASNAIPDYEDPLLTDLGGGFKGYSFTAALTDLSGNVAAATPMALRINDVDELANSFTFTAVTNAAKDTDYEHVAKTVAGLAAGVFAPITALGGTIKISTNGGSTFGPAVTSGNVQNGDEFKTQAHSSTLDATMVSVVVTIGDVPANQVSATYAVTTVDTFNPATIFDAAQYGWGIDPTDTAHVWQLITGATAGASGQPVGQIDDTISGASRNFKGTGNDSTRPTLTDIGGGVFALDFDGSNDVLFLTSAGLYGSGAGTTTLIFAAKNMNVAQVSKDFIMEGSSTSNNPVYIPATGISSTAQGRHILIRNNAAGEILQVNGSAGIYPNSWHVYTMIDDGASISIYKDRVLVATNSYVHSGTVTLNRTGLGAWMRAAAAVWTAVQLGRAFAIRKSLSGTEQANVELWCATPYGVSLP